MHSTATRTTNRLIPVSNPELVCRLRRSAASLVATGILFVFAGSPVVFAQASSGEDGARSTNALEEIIVTANRREEELRDLATSITVFTGMEIDRQNINDITTYFLKTPNVSITELESRDSNQIAMRGITNSGDGIPGTSFAFYIDEFNMQPFSNNPQLNDVAQIEVLRGPQGTYFGRNAAGGAINVTTNKPAAEFDANVALSYGRFSTWQLDGMVNVPMSDKAFLRAAVRNYDSDGYMINVNPAGGGSGESYFNGRLALRLVPTDRLTIDLTTIYAQNDLDSRFVVPTHQIPPGEAFIAGLDGYAISSGLNPYPLETRRFNEENPSQNNRDYKVVFGRLQYVGDNFMFTNVTGYGESKFHRGPGSADQTALDIIRGDETNDLDEFSTEFRLASVGDDNRLDWSFGGIYAEGGYNYHITIQTGPDVTQIILPVPPNITLINDRNNKEDHDTWAVFGELDWHVNDRLTLTYGARYNEEESKFGQTVAGNVTVPRSGGDYNKFISRFAATYDINEQFSIYGVASQGFKAGAAAANVGTGLAPVKPETLWNYEAGIRGELLDGRARFSLSAFKIDWQDLQVSTRVVSVNPATGAAIVTVGVQNAAKASSEGLEFEFQAVPTDSIELDFALGLLDAKYDSFPNAALTGLPNSVDLSGKRALQAPKVTASAGAQYNFNIGDAESFIRAEWAYVDDKLEDLLIYAPPEDFPPLPATGSDYYHVPSYDVFNLRAGVKMGNYSVDAWIENVADDNFYTGTYSGLFASGIGVYVHHRTYGVRFRWEFGE